MSLKSGQIGSLILDQRSLFMKMPLFYFVISITRLVFTGSLLKLANKKDIDKISDELVYLAKSDY